MYILERRGVTAGVVGVARRERVVKLERVRALIADITIEGRWGGGAVGRKSENGTSSIVVVTVQVRDWLNDQRHENILPSSYVLH